ncbi:FxSxx-COOH system tetratricopeptide repeat protein [Micromonospora siamensis]|nr:FxSxx-COOH system tetratricopeptide repeat protein [Micromonospora siamensis]
MSGTKKRPAPPDLFVSYAGPDRAWAEWAAWHLKAAGYSVELDVWDWAAGDNVTLRINDALDRAARVLALWSPSYFERDRFTTDEWTALMAQRPDVHGRRRLVPVRVAEVTPPPVVASLLHRDVFGLDEERARAVLLEAVQGPRDAKGRPEFPGTAKGRRTRGSGPRLPGVLPPVWNVPRRNAAFTGRGVPLVELRERLSGGSTAVVQALHGMGGVGKTTLAIEYAHRFAGSYDLVWWINAEQPTLIGEQFTALGAEAGWISADVQTTNSAALVLQRLRGETGWLLVFDNVEKREDLAAWLPQGAGHVLITSRNPGWDQLARPVPLPEFTRTESVQLLRHSLPALGGDRADELADRLGDLPLAVAQAAQVLDETGMGVADYLELLEKQTGEILSEGTPVGYPVPLAAVVRTSMERLSKEDEAAAQLLRVCAFLAPDPIPTDLFTAAPTGTLAPPLADTAASVLELAWSRGRIRGYGLARIGEQTIQLHRLTQAILRDNLDQDRRRGLRKQAEAILAAACPDDGRDPTYWPRWAQLIPHVTALDPAASDNEEFRELACHASSYLLSRGDLRAGRDFAERLHRGWTELLGPDDRQTLFAATNVANGDMSLGHYTEAQRLCEHIYQRRRHLLGDDDLDTLISANNLASNLHHLKQYDRAVELQQDTLERRRRIQGEDHPDTLTSAGNLAVVMRDVGKFEEAARLQHDTYLRRRRILGEDHRETLAAASHLAGDLGIQGRYAQALHLEQDTLSRRRRILGGDHPDTLKSLSSLATSLYLVGQYVQALHVQQDAHARQRRVMGDHHPSTLESAENLAQVLRAVGKAGEAKRLELWIQRHRPAGSPSPADPSPGDLD